MSVVWRVCPVIVDISRNLGIQMCFTSAPECNAKESLSGSGRSGLQRALQTSRTFSVYNTQAATGWSFQRTSWLIEHNLFPHKPFGQVKKWGGMSGVSSPSYWKFTVTKQIWCSWGYPHRICLFRPGFNRGVMMRHSSTSLAQYADPMNGWGYPSRGLSSLTQYISETERAVRWKMIYTQG